MTLLIKFIIIYLIISTILAPLQLFIFEMFTPKYMYKMLKLNWFGACVFGIPAMFFNGVLYVIYGIIVLFEVVKWLLTVGHKD